MNILKKENYWIWLLLLIFTGGTSTLILGALVDVFDNNAWYARYIKKLPKWVLIIIAIFIIIAASSMFLELLIESNSLATGALAATGIFAFVFAFVFIIGGILITIFNIQILYQTAAKLGVPGMEIYTSPYVWILCFIIPIIGWLFIPIMLVYLEIWIIVMLHRGNGEKYIK